MEISKEEYEKMQQAIHDLDAEFLSVDDFINKQIRNLLQKHQEWINQKEDYEKKASH